MFGDGKYLFWEEKKTEKEKLANTWKKKIFCLWRRRKMEKEREDDIWRRKGREIFGEGKYLFFVEKRSRERKYGKYV